MYQLDNTEEDKRTLSKTPFDFYDEHAKAMRKFINKSNEIFGAVDITMALEDRINTLAKTNDDFGCDEQTIAIILEHTNTLADSIGITLPEPTEVALESFSNMAKRMPIIDKIVESYTLETDEFSKNMFRVFDSYYAEAARNFKPKPIFDRITWLRSKVARIYPTDGSSDKTSYDGYMDIVGTPIERVNLLSAKGAYFSKDDLGIVNLYSQYEVAIDIVNKNVTEALRTLQCLNLEAAGQLNEANIRIQGIVEVTLDAARTMLCSDETLIRYPIRNSTAHVRPINPNAYEIPKPTPYAMDNVLGDLIGTRDRITEVNSKTKLLLKLLDKMDKLDDAEGINGSGSNRDVLRTLTVTNMHTIGEIIPASIAAVIEYTLANT